MIFLFFFQAEDGIRDVAVTGVQTCALPISSSCSLAYPKGIEPTIAYNAEPRGSRPWSCPKEQPVAGSTGGCRVAYSFLSGPTTEYALWIAAVQSSRGPGVQTPYDWAKPVGVPPPGVAGASRQASRASAGNKRRVRGDRVMSPARGCSLPGRHGCDCCHLMTGRLALAMTWTHDPSARRARMCVGDHARDRAAGAAAAGPERLLVRVRSRDRVGPRSVPDLPGRSEEHTSELQSRLHLVCRLLLEKKKKK